MGSFFDGGDRVLLRGEAASGRGGPGAFLSDGPAGDRSVPSGVACGAGGAGPEERGAPVAIRVTGLPEFAEGGQEAACLQAVHGGGPQGVATAAPVDPGHLNPLLRGLPGALKPHAQSLRGSVQRPSSAVSTSRGTRPRTP